LVGLCWLHLAQAFLFFYLAVNFYYFGCGLCDHHHLYQRLLTLNATLNGWCKHQRQAGVPISVDIQFGMQADHTG